jgi:hypothetical protein
MSTLAGLWQRSVRTATALLFPRYWLAVIEQEPLRVVFNSDNRKVTADGAVRTVHSAGKVLAAFDAIQSIDTVHHPRSDDKPEHWSLSLYLGRSARAYVGRSRKHAQVTKAATLLATITGKPQRSLEARNHPSVISTRS